MGKVVVGLSMSLDGYVAGPDDVPEHPLGRGGERLFAWMSAGPEANRIDRWMAPPDVPIFVVTHEAPTEGEWSPRVSFVTDGLEHAVELARAAAGDLDVSVCAADTAQQLLRSGLLDEIEVSVVPALLGGGIRLFDQRLDAIDLEQIGVIGSDGVTHLRYRVVRP
jgi:dihydrofolate reductase